MIEVFLEELEKKDPILSAKHAGTECYRSDNKPIAQFASKIDAENALWKSGHHTTFEHAAHYFTFRIEGISIGDITFGLHLVSSLYNTSQRSGRYCAKMFKEPDFSEMLGYIKILYPNLEENLIQGIEKYLRLGFSFYQDNLSQAEELAQKNIVSERPRVNDEYAVNNSVKFAQEQMRMFIPIIFPTGLVYTVDLPTLAALYKVAWLPGMRQAVNLMVQELLNKYPELSFMFPVEFKDAVDELSVKEMFAESFGSSVEVAVSPGVSLKEVSGKLIMPQKGDGHPLNVMPFLPRMMNNNLFRLVYEAKMSIATMGQDQRHRTISRSLPEVGNSFYLPPLLAELDLGEQAKELMTTWQSLKEKVPDSLLLCLAPYGAMVKYTKVSSGNAFLHEAGKRTCWCAQEEIYWLNCLLRQQLAQTEKVDPEVLQAISPKCIFSGVCAEGSRYCGRDMQATEKFPRRKV